VSPEEFTGVSPYGLSCNSEGKHLPLPRTHLQRAGNHGEKVLFDIHLLPEMRMNDAKKCQRWLEKLVLALRSVTL
jgi:hypothetical protein